jgi:hypothetical protein
MTLEATEFYHSSNGDSWSVIRHRGRVFVRHEPNEPSGGQISDIDVESFLARPRGPEQEAFLQLISQPSELRGEWVTLSDSDEVAAPTPDGAATEAR